MPEKTKQDEPDEKETEAAEKREKKDAGNWGEDQRERSYYYDDSYGYEIYNPDEDDDEEPSENFKLSILIGEIILQNCRETHAA